MAANTSFKLVDHLATYKASQYDFTFPSGFYPTYESQLPKITLPEMGNYPYENLSWYIDEGVTEKTINISGQDLDDSDRYVLQSSIANPRIKKLYLGDDWFYYVKGVSPLSSRDANLPTLHTYTASFLANDPCMYFDGTTASDYPAGTKGFGYGICGASTAGECTLNLTAKGSWFVEPTFWVTGETGNALTFTDERGVALTFTPSDDGLFIVLPYYRWNFINSNADYPAIVNPGSWAIADYDDHYAMDSSQELTSPELIKTTIAYTETNTKSLMNDYPQFTWNKSSNITVSGQDTDSNIRFQYRYRRM